MKKIIPFVKDIKFNTKIYEIVSISLEHNLNIENNIVSGEFIVSGDYKINDSSINTEPFIHGIPFDISLDNKYDTNNINIDIDDFKFEIINEEILRVNIDVLVDGIQVIEEEQESIEEIEEIKPDYIIEARNLKEEEAEKENDSQENVDNNLIENDFIEERQDDNMNSQLDDLFLEYDEPATMVLQENNNEVTSIFNNFNSKDEKYVSYYVHIVRENDTIDSICLKYGVSIEDIKEYNDIEQITLGNKIIVPYINSNEAI